MPGTVDVGTPAQRVPVMIDTGSDELWVDPECDSLTGAGYQTCVSASQYSPSQSTTAVSAEDATSLAYGSGTVDVAYVYDSISIPGTSNLTMEKVQFGVATASEGIPLGILGVGFGYGYNLKYYSLLDELVGQAVTPTRAFSLVLGTSNATGDTAAGADIADGSFIFSGVDTKKFAGPLQAFDNLDPQAGDNNLWRYWVQLQNATYTAKGKTASTVLYSSLPVVLDSGSSLSYLPSAFLSALAGALGLSVDTGTSSGTNGTIPIACDAGADGGTVDFAFGSSLAISVPLADLIWGSDGSCIVGMLPSDGGTALLGDTFLRSAYVLFDQDNRKIYLAEAANCGTNEQALANATSYNFTGECTRSSADQLSAAAAKSAAAAVLPGSLATVLLAFAGVQMLMAMM